MFRQCAETTKRKGSPMANFKVRAEVVRKTIDPFFNTKKHGSETITYYNCFFNISHLVTKMADMPIKPANPRDHDNLPNKQVMKEMRQEFLSDTNMFHLKNSGITINVKHIEELGENTLSVHIDDDPEMRHGIMNGGTTYTVLRNTVKELIENGSELPQNQFVKVEFRVGTRPDIVPSISEGLNTHASVTESSMLELNNRFDFIKTALKNQSYSDQISYRQYEDGELDITRLLQIMTMFDISHYNSEKHPNRAYTTKISIVKSFKNDDSAYKKIAPKLPEILEIYDALRHEASIGEALKNKKTSKYVKSARNEDEFKLLTQGITIQHDMHDAFIWPVLAAFRMFLRENSQGEYQWTMPFHEVRGLAIDLSNDLFVKMDQIYKDLGDLSALGRLSSTWETTYLFLQRKSRELLPVFSIDPTVDRVA